METRRRAGPLLIASRYRAAPARGPAGHMLSRHDKSRPATPDACGLRGNPARPKAWDPRRLDGGPRRRRPRSPRALISHPASGCIGRRGAEARSRSGLSARLPSWPRVSAIWPSEQTRTPFGSAGRRWPRLFVPTSPRTPYALPGSRTGSSTSRSQSSTKPGPGSASRSLRASPGVPEPYRAQGRLGDQFDVARSPRDQPSRA